MVILVTGGSGFIGSHIVDKLVEKGYQIRVFDLNRPYSDDVEWFKGDILNLEDLLKACKDIEYIFHLAAIADVNVAISHPDLCIKVNELGTLNLLKAATANEVERIILASTTWVYGKTEGVVTEETPLPPPDNIYTKTKIGQEHLVISWSNRYNMPYTILRYGIPYGPRMRENMAIAIFVKKALRNETITIFGDGKQGRCFIYVEDLAEGNIAALSEKAKYQILNMAGKEFVTLNMVIDELRRIFDKVIVKYDMERIGDFRGVIVNIEKAKILLDWEPRVSFREGLRKYLDYIKSGSDRKLI
jgi:UDP-glucose 4-epimerase